MRRLRLILLCVFAGTLLVPVEAGAAPGRHQPGLDHGVVPAPRHHLHRRHKRPRGHGASRKKEMPVLPADAAAPTPVPSPQSRPAEGAAPKTPAVVPVPPAPAPASKPTEGAKPQQTVPAVAPVPTPAPQGETEPAGDAAAPAGKASGEPVARPVSSAADEQACRARLGTYGAVWQDRPAETDAKAGCDLAHPMFLTRLSRQVALEPGALVNCAVAETAARFAHDVMEPAARKIVGADLASLGELSGYVCRMRNGTDHISEHAFGNALDIGRFTFADGAVAEVGAAAEGAETQFIAAVRKQACGAFKTVLGPGSNADHARHLHLDLEPRPSGGTVCQ